MCSTLHDHSTRKAGEYWSKWAGSSLSHDLPCLLAAYKAWSKVNNILQLLQQIRQNQLQNRWVCKKSASNRLTTIQVVLSKKEGYKDVQLTIPLFSFTRFLDGGLHGIPHGIRFFSTVLWLPWVKHPNSNYYFLLFSNYSISRLQALLETNNSKEIPRILDEIYLKCWTKIILPHRKTGFMKLSPDSED